MSATAALFGERREELLALYRCAGPCHDVGHALRVAALAEELAAEERCDARLAALAGLYHDCAGHERGGRAEHELASAAQARRLLAGTLPAAELEQVLDAIAGRRFAKLGAPGAPRAPLGRILDDADNLDALGHVGVARAFLHVGEHGWEPLLGDDAPQRLAQRPHEALSAHWSAKLRRLPALMWTARGRALAAARAEAMERYLTGLRAEVS